MKSALIIVDVQAGLARNNPLTTKAIKEAVPRLRQLMPIIWVYGSWLQEEKPFQVKDHPALTAFNRAAGPLLKPALEAGPEDWIITKTSASFLGSPYARPFLRQQGIDQLYFAGIETMRCVVASASDAKADFDVAVLSELTADYRDLQNRPQEEISQLYDIPFRSLSTLGLS